MTIATLTQSRTARVILTIGKWICIASSWYFLFMAKIVLLMFTLFALFGAGDDGY
ncbi:MAG: hypothetical protein R1F54_01715 [Candidatus Zeuxoniibacter abyssi]|nr:MAG: hypothetical protein R1F54_01715 [Candidatus Persebacteraceae bacterium AB1(2)]